MCEFKRILKGDFMVTECEPFMKPVIHKMGKGTVIFISQPDGMEEYKLGDRYYNDKFMVTRIIHEPKKWWQFWKPKKIEGYRMEYVGD